MTAVGCAPSEAKSRVRGGCAAGRVRLGSAGMILRTVDGGRSWERRDPPGAQELQFRDIEAFDARTAVALTIGEGVAPAWSARAGTPGSRRAAPSGPGSSGRPTAGSTGRPGTPRSRAARAPGCTGWRRAAQDGCWPSAAITSYRERHPMGRRRAGTGAGPGPSHAVSRGSTGRVWRGGVSGRSRSGRPAATSAATAAGRGSASTTAASTPCSARERPAGRRVNRDVSRG